MSSWTFESYANEELNIHGEYRWNKGGGFEVSFGHKHNGLVYSDIFHKTYAQVKSARRAFKRQVNKIKHGECN